MIDKCRISSNSRVLDIACGKGTTSILLARKHQCRVIGIDINEELIEEARKMAKKHKVNNLVEFQVGDATNLSFQDNEFDATIAQAMLVLIDNKDKVVKEALRVLKPEGKAGWIELTWQKQPSDEFMKQVSEVICAYCMLNVRLINGWNDLFINSDINGILKGINSLYSSLNSNLFFFNIFFISLFLGHLWGPSFFIFKNSATSDIQDIV